VGPTETIGHACGQGGVATGQIAVASRWRFPVALTAEIDPSAEIKWDESIDFSRIGSTVNKRDIGVLSDVFRVMKAIMFAQNNPIVSIVTTR
jgi:hypothetical protein